ncbi:MAG: hypothetical protein IKY23_06580 [Lachnospiraceae bacterium]|nr:hypothetical protein [Lachnospiraceae bacterium]
MRIRTKIRNLIVVMLSVICIIMIIPSTKVEASSVTVYGGHTSMGNAYNWGSYSQYNSILVVLPANENDFWISVNLPSDSHVFARSSYDSDYLGMVLESWTSTSIIESHDSAVSVYDPNTVIPFLAVALDNNGSSTDTYYIHVNRGLNYSGIMYFTISMGERFKTGHGVFPFSGTASNPGNNPFSYSGRDSSVLTLNLSTNNNIPPGAIVTSVSTSGTQSPSQGNVHHMIMPANPGTWYTSNYSSNSSGSYSISVTDEIAVKQVWSFKYNAMATAKSTMKNVQITFDWRYDIANNGYHTF